MKNKILVCIVNHNCNENAKVLNDMFALDFKTLVLDSGSNIKNDTFIQLGNVFYSGLFNRAVEETIKNNKKWLFFICSDVQIQSEEYWKLIRRLENEKQFNDIAVYSPSSVGRSHFFCKSQGTKSLRDVNMIEGFIFMARIEILQKMYPVDLKINKLGWGLDIMKGYLALNNNMRCVIDDLVSVYHPEGSGYGQDEAMREMQAYINSKGIEFKNFVKTKIRFSV